MAIKSDYKKFGVTFKGAYTKISTVEYSNGFSESWQMSEDPSIPPQKFLSKVLRVQFQHQTFPDATSSELIDNKVHHITLNDADSLFEDCYNYLKSLPEFSGAIDA
jgi:hypothetical protein